MKPDFSDDPLRGYYIDTYHNIVGHAPHYGWAIGHRATDCCIMYGFMEKQDAERSLKQIFKWFDLMDQQENRIRELEAKLKSLES
jgi:hypothetical protein